MMAARYWFLIGAIALGVTGQIALKTGAVNPSFERQLFAPATIVGLACYGLAAFGYMIAIRYIPLSVAYPSVAMGYVIVAALAHFLWNEPVSVLNLGGIALIIAGVALLHVR